MKLKFMNRKPISLQNRESLILFEKWLASNTPRPIIGLSGKNQYQIKVPDYLRQYGFYFLPKDHWQTDYAWPSFRFIVEIEGGAFIPGGGGHNRGEHFRKDMVRYNTMTAMGFTIYRFMYEMLPMKSSYAIDTIKQFFNTLEGA